MQYGDENNLQSMLSSRGYRRSVSIGFALTSLTLITFVYMGSPTNNYYTMFQNFQLSRDRNASQLSEIRLLCLILTSPKSISTRAKAVHDTWAPECDRYFFITEYPREKMTPEQIRIADEIPIAPIKNITPGYDHLTQKSTLAFLFAYENYFNDFDWFIKADDDTFLIVEHLKAFLSEKNTSEPVTFGYNFKLHVQKGYHSGGASYVLSRESLRRFNEAHNNSSLNCHKDGGSEDVEIALCLRKKGVYPGKSLDKQNRELFHPLSFADHFRGSFPDWFATYSENPPQTNYDCCSDQTISFHYVKPEEQYLMHFLLYKVRSKPNIYEQYINNSQNNTENPVN